MRLPLVLAVCLGLAFAPTESRADKFTSEQPIYSQVGDNCGTGGAKRTYSQAEYTQALAAAERAKRAAKGNKALQTAIARNISDIKECQAEGATTPPLVTCADMAYQMDNFTVGSLLRVSRGSMTKAERAKELAKQAKDLEKCMREAFQRCVDPTKTADFDRALKLLEAGRALGFYKSTEWFVDDESPRIVLEVKLPGKDAALTFCTDSNYSCKEETLACMSRIARFRSMLSKPTKERLVSP